MKIEKNSEGTQVKMYEAKIILDSISEGNVRLVTMELLYPLIVHYDFLTHRKNSKSDDVEYEEWIDFSRNAASNRGIPSAKVLGAIAKNPHVPRFRYNTNTMFPGAYLSIEDQFNAELIWLEMLDHLLDGANKLADLNVHKQWRNKIFTAFQHITVVATANYELWEHYFSLRAHQNAQDELRIISELGLEALKNSVPQFVEYGSWHLPYVTNNPMYDIPDLTLSEKREISVAKCAGTSFLRQNEEYDVDYYLGMYKRLLESTPAHGSPFEHVAKATYAKIRSGNFIGWIQLRKMLEI